MSAFNAQQAVRQNASELSDYLSDLKAWGNEMEQKEQQLKENNSKPTHNNKNLPPIRNQIAATAKFEQNVKFYICNRCLIKM